ncbi:MAG: hypothetical protein M3494_08980 [Actinomycetota bacterium]|nr:hypothetical protein [Rubrobacter sp.]MDQ3508133.1 hypothetical protein [Actinomycetota bacterium]
MREDLFSEEPGFRFQVSGFRKNVRWRVPDRKPNVFETTFFVGEGRVEKT